MAERVVANDEVAGSIPVSRSKIRLLLKPPIWGGFRRSLILEYLYDYARTHFIKNC